MKYIKSYNNYIFEKYDINESEIIDDDLEDFRFFRGSLLQFKNFWERKMSKPFNPHGNVKYKYPIEREEQDKSLPYQDFTNSESSGVKYKLKNRAKGKINERTMSELIESLNEFKTSFTLNENETSKKIADLDNKLKDAEKNAKQYKEEYEKLKADNSNDDTLSLALLKYNKYKTMASLFKIEIKLLKKEDNSSDE